MNMIVTRTIRIQLKTTPEQAALLRRTMEEYTRSFNEVCHVADAEKVSNGVELHKLTYATQRATTHLPSQLICAARVKATEAIKSVVTRRKKQEKKYQALQKHGKATKPLKLACTPHSALCAIRYDARSFRFDRLTRTVSLVHVQQEGQRRNRALVSVKVPAYYEHYLTPQWNQESADLLYRHGSFWLHMVVSCEQTTTLPTAENKTIGALPNCKALLPIKRPIAASMSCLLMLVTALKLVLVVDISISETACLKVSSPVASAATAIMLTRMLPITLLVVP
jgi:hypothetical protein